MNSAAGDTSLQISDFSTVSKYRGLLKEKATKKLRNNCFTLITYLDDIVPTFETMHKFISIWRIIQIYGATLGVSNRHFWNQDSTLYKALSYVSILFHIVPSEFRLQSAGAFEIFYILFSVLYYLCFVISSFYFNQNASLPKSAAYSLSIVLNTVMQLIQPAAMQLTGEIMSYVIWDKVEVPFGKIAATVIVVLTIIIFEIYVTSYQSIFGISALFRPGSINTLLPAVQVSIIQYTGLISLFSGLSTQVSWGWLFLAISTILCVLLCLAVFSAGGIINTTYRKLVFAVSTAGILNTVAQIVYWFLPIEVNEVEFLVLIAALVGLYFLGSFIITKSINNRLTQLDSMMEDQDLLSDFRSPSEAIQYITIGMIFAHPVCISWDIFKVATELWPNNAHLWIIYAKFAAIYPEENSILTFIARSIVNNGVKGFMAKQIVFQILAIQQHRETNVSPKLKSEMNRVQKSVLATKRKMRLVWDQVIQGNLSEVESNLIIAHNAVEKSNTEFAHIMKGYPNNRFVARMYTHYTREVLADRELFHTWIEYTRMLQRGMAIMPDQAHELGILEFPMLPDYLRQNGVSQPQSMELGSESIQDVDVDDDQGDTERGGVIEDLISQMKIPGYRSSIVISWVDIAVILAVIIGLTVYAAVYRTEMLPPMYILESTANLRMLAFKVTPLLHHYILESVPYNTNGDIMFDKLDLTQYNFSSINNVHSIRDQINYLIHQIVANLEDLMEYNNFASDDVRFAKARELLFDATITYKIYESYTSDADMKPPTEKNRTLQFIMSDLAAQSSVIMNQQLSTDILKTTAFLNPGMNNALIVEDISDACQAVIDYIFAKSDGVGSYVALVAYFVLAVVIIIIVVETVVMIYRINSNKRTVFKCLLAIPKNIVSQLSESMKTLKHDDDGTGTTTNTEMSEDVNRQEENIIKIFATAGDSGSGSIFELIFLIVTMALYIGVFVGCVIEIISMFNQQHDVLKGYAPHLDNSMGISAYMFGILQSINTIAATIKGVPTYNLKVVDLVTRTNDRVVQMQEYYEKMRFGSVQSVPYKFYEDMQNIVNKECEYGQRATSLRESYECLQPSSQIMLLQGMVANVLTPVNEQTTDFDSKSPMFNELWYLGFYYLHDSFLHGLFNSIPYAILAVINDIVSQGLVPIIILSVIAIVFAVAFHIVQKKSEERVMFAFKMLMHCQSSIILKTPQIMSVLGGNFDQKERDYASRTQEFFDEVVKDLPFSVIITDHSLSITSFNKRTEQMLLVAPTLGMHIRDYFNEDRFIVPPSRSILVASSTTETEAFEMRKQDGSPSHLTITRYGAGNDIIFTTRDETENVTYQRLIAEERAKSDRLLMSILPPSLVRRVQQGEKNISFAVQSATIVFIDIVEFTPWCASMTASMVMSTLNKLFMRFDMIINSKTQMSRIKCIGDCYMAAGGIFSEVNQPGLHAKEAIEFGLEAIAAVEELNKEIDQNLKIRVGVNTGGPIVAGVLGTDKPTFEILGPTINMAQQMEHHGVPSHVHISRAVYELVYGGPFEIKERGQIEIKAGSVVTYLVNSKR